MKSIFQYTSYRNYLLDFYQARKIRNKNFSYQLFANLAGFKSKSFIKLVIDGKKNLSPDSAQKINKVLKLNEKAFSYFEDLVAFNQAESTKIKNYFFNKLTSYNKRNPGRLVLKQEYEFYSKWYHNAMRELVCLINFREDYQKLGKLLQPPITARQAKESVQLLLELKLIEKKEGRYQQTDRLLTTGNEVRSLAVANFHLQNFKIAGESLDTTPPLERDISALVVGLSDAGFERIKDEIQKFRKKLLQIAGDDTQVNRVYHVNFQFWPTSAKIQNEEES